jgi:hypothetical protein
VRPLHVCVSALAVLAILWSTPPLAASPIAVVDQQNPGPFTTTNGVSTPFYFGQSFTPTLSGIDAIEFLLGGANATVVVDILSSVSGADGLGGTVIATSNPVSYNVPSGQQVIHFDFASTVALTPGQTYVARLHNLSGQLFVRHTQGNAYTGGQFLHQGFAPSTFSGTDLVFREGLHAQLNPVPEPTTLALWGVGIAGTAAVVRLRHRRRSPEPAASR